MPAAEIAHERHRGTLARVAARLVDHAEPYYDSALDGVAALASRFRKPASRPSGLWRAAGHRAAHAVGLARPYLERHAVHGAPGAVRFDETFDTQQGVRHGPVQMA